LSFGAFGGSSSAQRSDARESGQDLRVRSGVGTALSLSHQALDLRYQRRGLDLERSGQLAQSRERGLTDSALHLADESAVHVGTQGQRLLRNAARVAQFPQDLA